MDVVSVVRRPFVLGLAFVLLLVACSRDPGTPEIVPSLVPLATVTAQMAAAAATAEVDSTAVESTPDDPDPTATATPPPTETVAPQTLTVNDQQLHEDGRLTIARVETSQPGWVVVNKDEDGDIGEIMGYVEVAAGVIEDLVIEIDPLVATPQLYAVLHADEGEPGLFEFPGPDSPIQVDSSAVASDFMVEISVRLPSLVVSDQIMAEDETIIIDAVVATKPSWIALHMDEEGEPGQMLGFLPVETGETANLSMVLNWRRASPILHAVLYEDAGESNVYEDPEIDAPVEVDGRPIAGSFLVTMPPDIFVLDQPVVDGEIVVEQVISYGPGWIVVYHDVEGNLGNIIGWAALEDGFNRDIRFPIVESAVTPVLHAMIHQDLEEVGEFGFPRTDPPVTYRERVPNPVTFRTDGGNYLVVMDQTLSASDTITVPLVVVDQDAFVVLRAEEDDQPADIVGTRWLPAGVNRYVSVELDPEGATDTLYAELFLDANSDQELDYPDGLDIPMQRNRAIIQAHFALLTPDED
ncbi:MAG: hypothetical protein JSW55_09955 [Chloroflexota bacterium]|nr:MAG: hypothetical protein JSW55_09955 [Chloroflexota bacterium]